MQGKTHLVVGITSALLIMQPNAFNDLVMGIGAAAVGSLISDIDVETSVSHKKADYIVRGSILMLLILAALDFSGKMSVWNHISANELWIHKIVGLCILLVICAYGKEQPHRSLMHSLIVLAALGWCIKLLIPSAYMYFCIGLLSHLGLDVFNKKGIQLFYPYRKRFCLKLCSAGGKIDSWIGNTGTVAMAAIIGWCLFKIII